MIPILCLKIIEERMSKMKQDWVSVQVTHAQDYYAIFYYYNILKLKQFL